jgi:NTP pyrophosphatase (non-canonical NTP hydrolase)
MKKQDLYRQTIQRWGTEGQIDMFHEEVGKLLSALNKYKRGRVPAKELITEIADVQIMTEQLAEMFGSVAVYNEKLRKLDRLARRVQKAALQEVGIEVTDEGEPMERYKNRMSCKHCGMEEICCLRSHHGPNGGITMSCNMHVKCRRNQNWDREHQFQIATVEGEV